MGFRKVVAWAFITIFVFGFIGCSWFTKAAATVNGEKIPMSEVDKQLDRISSQHKTAQQKQAFAKQKKQIQKQIVDVLIDEALFRQEAEKMGIKVSDKEIDDEVNRTKKRFPSEAEFAKALKDANLTMDDLKDIQKNRLIQERVQKKIVGKTTVTSEEMQQYFEKNKKDFKQPEQSKVSNILVKTEDEAKKIRAEIEGGMDFAEAAGKYSEDPASKTRGGDLGFVQKGIMAPEFDAAAFSLPIGEVSQPVKTQVGWYLIKVFEKKEAADKTYEEVKPSIEQMLKAQKESDKIRKWLEGVKKTAKIQILV